MSYQSLPEGCGIIERAREDAAVGELLQFVPMWARDGFQRDPAGLPWPEADALCRELARIAADRPGLQQRNCFLDRRWDMLAYLLSAVRREERAGEVDVVLNRAVRGGDVIASHVIACQGVPIKFLPPGDVLLAATALDEMSVETLGQHFDPQGMEELGVYKFWADQADQTWPWIVESFEQFRRFYIDAAEHGEGVLACLD